MRRTYVPVPGPRPSRSKETPSKIQLSQEFIRSDDDDESPAEKAPAPAPAPQTKPKTTIAIHKSNGIRRPGAESSAEQSATPDAQSKAKPTPKKPAPRQIVTQAQADELSTTSDPTDDDQDDTSMSDAQTNSQEKKAPMSDSNSDSDSDSDGNSSSSGVESVEHEAPQPASIPTPAQTSQTQSHAVDFRPAQVFLPPKGFSAVPYGDRTASKTARIFDNLEGKQVWHITTPLGVPLKELKEIAMDSAVNGEPVLQHKGTSYSISTSGQREKGSCEVMVSSRSGYKAVSMPIAQSLRLQAAVQLPKLSSLQAHQIKGSEAAASITRSTIRAPRPQLKGLKVRFLPTGFGGGEPGTLGDSDSEGESAQEIAGPAMANELKLPCRKVKRKHTEMHTDSRIEPPSKKHKNPRTTEDVQHKEERRAKKERKRAQGIAASKP